MRDDRQRPTTAKSDASRIAVAASARGAQAGSGERATVVSSTANGSVKKSSRLAPASMSSAQRSDAKANAKKAAAGSAIRVAAGRGSPAKPAPGKRGGGGCEHEVQRQQTPEPPVLGHRHEQAVRAVELERRAKRSGDQHGHRYQRRTSHEEPGRRGEQRDADDGDRAPLALASLSSPVVPSAAASPTSAAASRISPASRAPRPRQEHEHRADGAAYKAVSACSMGANSVDGARAAGRALRWPPPPSPAVERVGRLAKTLARSGTKLLPRMDEVTPRVAAGQHERGPARTR